MATIVITHGQSSAAQEIDDGDDLLFLIPILASTINRQEPEPLAPTLQSLLDLHNQARAANQTCGDDSKPAVAPLQWNDKLAKVAFGHAKDMQENDFFSHTGSDGSSVGSRATNQGYIWSIIGENIARGQSSAETVTQAWLDSVGHCNNIMDSRFKHIGAAEVERHWVIVLGNGS